MPIACLQIVHTQHHAFELFLALCWIDGCDFDVKNEADRNSFQIYTFDHLKLYFELSVKDSFWLSLALSLSFSLGFELTLISALIWMQFMNLHTWKQAANRWMCIICLVTVANIRFNLNLLRVSVYGLVANTCQIFIFLSSFNRFTLSFGLSQS